MREAVDSPKEWVTRSLMTPVRLTQPEATSVPLAASRGRLSPVRATVSRLVEPSTTVPSRGTFSPGFTTMTSPGCTVSGATVSSWPPRSTWAVSGRMSISLAMDSRLRSSA